MTYLRKSIGLRLFVCQLILCLWLLPADAQVDTSTLQLLDDTQASVVLDQARYNRRTGEVSYRATLSNNSAGDLNGPFYYEISSINNAQVSAINYDDTTGSGNPVYIFSETTVAAGASISRTIMFSNPRRARFDYTSNLFGTPAFEPLEASLNDAVEVEPGVFERYILLDSDKVIVNGRYENHSGGVQITASAGARTVNSVSNNGTIRLILPISELVWQITITEQDSPERSIGLELRFLQDTAAPVITISGNSVRNVNQDFIILNGTVSDSGTGVQNLYAISDRYADMQFAVSSGDGSFSVELPLKPGQNILSVYAVDAANNSASASVTVNRKIALIPEVVINAPLAGYVYNETISVSGVIYSSQALELLNVTLRRQETTPNATSVAGVYHFQFSQVRLTEGFNELVVKVVSPAGNGQASVSVHYEPDQADPGVIAPPSIALSSVRNGTVTNSDSIILAGAVSSDIGVDALTVNGVGVDLIGATQLSRHFKYEFDLTAQAIGDIAVDLVATDTQNQTTTKTLSITVDRQAPVIALTSAGVQLPPDSNTVVELPYRLQGNITDSNLAQATINGQSLGLLPGASDDIYEFDLALELPQGTGQTVTLEARDLAGNYVTQELIFDVSTPVGIDIITPRDNSEIIADESGTVIDVAVRLLDMPSDHSVEVLVNDGQAQGMTVDGNAATAAVVTNLTDGEHILYVRVLNASGAVVSQRQSRFTLFNAANIPLELQRSDPVNAQTHVEPNQIITAYFTRAIDPSLIQVEVKETVHGLDYDLSNQQAKSFLDLPEPQLLEVHRDMEDVPGGLLYGPDNRFVTFQPGRTYAYTAQIYVDVIYDGASLGRFNFQVKPLPTLLIGRVTDQLQTPLGGIDIELPELGLQTKTKPNGNFSFRIEAKTHPIKNGRYHLSYNANLKNPHFGSHETLIDIEAGRLNRLTKQVVPQLSTAIGFTNISGGKIHSLASGKLKLNLNNATLQFPNGRNAGAVHVQFTPFEHFTATIDQSVMPHWLYAVQPSGVLVNGDVDVEIEMPKLYGSYAYIPANGTYVLMAGFDPDTGMIVLGGVGEIQDGKVKNIGKLSIQSLNYIGYAFVGEGGQELLAEYVSGEISSLQVLRTELLKLFNL